MRAKWHGIGKKIQEEVLLPPQLNLAIQQIPVIGETLTLNANNSGGNIQKIEYFCIVPGSVKTKIGETLGNQGFILYTPTVPGNYTFFASGQNTSGSSEKSIQANVLNIDYTLVFTNNIMQNDSHNITVSNRIGNPSEVMVYVKHSSNQDFTLIGSANSSNNWSVSWIPILFGSYTIRGISQKLYVANVLKEQNLNVLEKVGISVQLKPPYSATFQETKLLECLTTGGVETVQFLSKPPGGATFNPIITDSNSGDGFFASFTPTVIGNWEIKAIGNKTGFDPVETVQIYSVQNVSADLYIPQPVRDKSVCVIEARNVTGNPDDIVFEVKLASQLENQYVPLTKITNFSASWNPVGNPTINIIYNVRMRLEKNGIFLDTVNLVTVYPSLISVEPPYSTSIGNLIVPNNLKSTKVPVDKGVWQDGYIHQNQVQFSTYLKPQGKDEDTPLSAQYHPWLACEIPTVGRDFLRVPGVAKMDLDRGDTNFGICKLFSTAIGIKSARAAIPYNRKKYGFNILEEAYAEELSKSLGAIRESGMNFMFAINLTDDNPCPVIRTAVPILEVINPGDRIVRISRFSQAITAENPNNVNLLPYPNDPNHKDNYIVEHKSGFRRYYLSGSVIKSKALDYSIEEGTQKKERTASHLITKILEVTDTSILVKLALPVYDTFDLNSVNLYDKSLLIERLESAPFFPKHPIDPVTQELRYDLVNPQYVETYTNFFNFISILIPFCMSRLQGGKGFAYQSVEWLNEVLMAGSYLAAHEYYDDISMAEFNQEYNNNGYQILHVRGTLETAYEILCDMVDIMPVPGVSSKLSATYLNGDPIIINRWAHLANNVITGNQGLTFPAIGFNNYIIDGRGNQSPGPSAFDYGSSKLQRGWHGYKAAPKQTERTEATSGALKHYFKKVQDPEWKLVINAPDYEDKSSWIDNKKRLTYDGQLADSPRVLTGSLPDKTQWADWEFLSYADPELKFSMMFTENQMRDIADQNEQGENIITNFSAKPHGLRARSLFDVIQNNNPKLYDYRPKWSVSEFGVAPTEEGIGKFYPSTTNLIDYRVSWKGMPVPVNSGDLAMKVKYKNAMWWWMLGGLRNAFSLCVFELFAEGPKPSAGIAGSGYGFVLDSYRKDVLVPSVTAHRNANGLNASGEINGFSSYVVPVGWENLFTVSVSRFLNLIENYTDFDLSQELLESKTNELYKFIRVRQVRWEPGSPVDVTWAYGTQNPTYANQYQNEPLGQRIRVGLIQLSAGAYVLLNGINFGQMDLDGPSGNIYVTIDDLPSGNWVLRGNYNPLTNTWTQVNGIMETTPTGQKLTVKMQSADSPQVCLITRSSDFTLRLNVPSDIKVGDPATVSAELNTGTSVTFYAKKQLDPNFVSIGTDNSSPYEVVWEPVEAGEWIIKAVTNLGEEVTSLVNVEGLSCSIVLQEGPYVNGGSYNISTSNVKGNPDSIEFYKRTIGSNFVLINTDSTLPFSSTFQPTSNAIWEIKAIMKKQGVTSFETVLPVTVGLATFLINVQLGLKVTGLSYPVNITGTPPSTTAVELFLTAPGQSEISLGSKSVSDLNWVWNPVAIGIHTFRAVASTGTGSQQVSETHEVLSLEEVEYENVYGTTNTLIPSSIVQENSGWILQNVVFANNYEGKPIYKTTNGNTESAILFNTAYEGAKVEIRYRRTDLAPGNNIAYTTNAVVRAVGRYNYPTGVTTYDDNFSQVIAERIFTIAGNPNLVRVKSYAKTNAVLPAGQEIINNIWPTGSRGQNIGVDNGSHSEIILEMILTTQDMLLCREYLAGTTPPDWKANQDLIVGHYVRSIEASGVTGFDIPRNGYFGVTFNKINCEIHEVKVTPILSQSINTQVIFNPSGKFLEDVIGAGVYSENCPFMGWIPNDELKAGVVEGLTTVKPVSTLVPGPNGNNIRAFVWNALNEPQGATPNDLSKASNIRSFLFNLDWMNGNKKISFNQRAYIKPAYPYLQFIEVEMLFKYDLSYWANSGGIWIKKNTEQMIQEKQLGAVCFHYAYAESNTSTTLEELIVNEYDPDISGFVRNGQPLGYSYDKDNYLGNGAGAIVPYTLQMDEDGKPLPLFAVTRVGGFGNTDLHPYARNGWIKQRCILQISAGPRYRAEIDEGQCAYEPGSTQRQDYINALPTPRVNFKPAVKLRLGIGLHDGYFTGRLYIANVKAKFVSTSNG